MYNYMLISKIDNFRPIFSPGDNICPYYLINKNGDIFSLYSGKFLTQIVTDSGYRVVSLNTTDGKRIQRRVHRLAMYTFNYQSGCENMQVDHLYGDKSNNFIDDCQWVTGKENVNRAINLGLRKSWKGENNPNSKITEQDVYKIINLALSGYNLEQIVQIIPNSNESIIKDILLGRTWRNIIDDDLSRKLRELIIPTILSIQDKHRICNFFQNNNINSIFGENKYGSVTKYIHYTLNSLNIEDNESTFRMCKRLYYRYQDPEITNLYNY